jgi:hypothetical protein
MLKEKKCIGEFCNGKIRPIIVFEKRKGNADGYETKCRMCKYNKGKEIEVGICKYCKSKHDCLYGSGLFCDRKCQAIYTNKNRTKNINKVNDYLKNKYTKEELFIINAKKIHGNKYNYSKVKYWDTKTKVIIICPIHGEFQQNLYNHSKGAGCKQCSIEENNNKHKFTKEEFINKAIELHGKTYDYSKVEYSNSQTKVTIICKIHGEFKKEPAHHLQGQGCAKCGYEITSLKLVRPLEEFIKKSKKMHFDFYDYSKVKYINDKTKVEIICPFHGSFHQRPYSHLHGEACRKCGDQITATKSRLSYEDFIKRCNKIHNSKYDYSLVKYFDTSSKIEIICPKHGSYIQNAYGHLKGSGCHKCANIAIGDSRRHTTQIFINKAIKVHGYRYNYSELDYIGNLEPINILCKKHGIFLQKPVYHLQGHGCNKCSKSGFSKTQIEVLEFIMDKQKIFINHATNGGEHRINNYKVDGYCKELNTVYEYNGDFHHGCPFTQNLNDINRLNKKPQYINYENTIIKEKKIKLNGYNLVSIWEGDWYKYKKYLYNGKLSFNEFYTICEINNIQRYNKYIDHHINKLDQLL